MHSIGHKWHMLFVHIQFIRIHTLSHQQSIRTTTKTTQMKEICSFSTFFYFISSLKKENVRFLCDLSFLKILLCSYLSQPFRKCHQYRCVSQRISHKWWDDILINIRGLVTHNLFLTLHSSVMCVHKLHSRYIN